MLKYRKITELSDEEICFIVQDILNPLEIKILKRDKEAEEIRLSVTTGGWLDEEGASVAMTDEVVLSETGISAHDFMTYPEEDWKIRQYLLTKGCNGLLKDNPYWEDNDVVNEKGLKERSCDEGRSNAKRCV